MSDPLIVLRQFIIAQEAINLKNLLEEHGINAMITDNIPTFDVSFAGNTHQNKYEVKIHNDDHEKAIRLLETLSINDAEEVTEDYYLYGFSNSELYAIINKYDEWSEYDYFVATKILRERGESLYEDRIKELKELRNLELSQPDHIHKGWILLGYFLAFTGFYGIIFGYVIWTSTKTLPNGEKIPTYGKYVSKDGKTIFYIGITALIIFGIIKLFALS